MRERFVGVAAATAVMLAATGVVAWQVLRPAEVSTPAIGSLPVASQPAPGALGMLVSAPLVIDDRIRVYAKKREVWADGPPFSHYERSAYWAYRRWPAEVTGILAVKTDRPLIVSTWSDGMIVAIDAGTGTVAWRVEDAEPLAKGYGGRLTGAQTVYSPPGLFATGGSAFITVGEQVTARSVASGQTLWTAPLPDAPECRGTTFTTTGGQLLMHDTCTDSLAALEITSGRTLQPRPAETVESLSCQVGHSGCQAMRVTVDGKVTAWTLAESTPVQLPPLAKPGALYNGRNVIVPQPDTASLSAVDADGRVLWTWHPSTGTAFRLLSADSARVLLIQSEPDGSGNALVSLEAATGRLKTYASTLMQHERKAPYNIGRWYVAGSYLVLERTNVGVKPSADDDEYYFTSRPILIASAGA